MNATTSNTGNAPARPAARCGARPHGAPVDSLPRGSLAMFLLLGACAQPAPPPPSPELGALTQRVQHLEDRLDRLERRLASQPSAPLRGRAEIERNIQSLERQREALLQRLMPSHPEVREIDLSLRLLRLQLDMIDSIERAPR